MRAIDEIKCDRAGADCLHKIVAVNRITRLQDTLNAVAIGSNYLPAYFPDITDSFNGGVKDTGWIDLITHCELRKVLLPRFGVLGSYSVISGK